MKIGFAITAYDKFEEAQIMFEIIRKEFKNDYKISFCSNHPDGKEFAEKNNVDNYIQARDIPNFSGDQHIYGSLTDKILIRLRSTDSVQKSCLGAMNMDVDYIIHMHSDAWCLSENKLLDLIKEMKKLDKVVALRGAGLEEFYTDTPVGHMDDHFFVFEKKYFLENKVFEFEPELFFPERFTVHGIIFVNILVKVGLDKLWYYANTQKLENYDNKLLDQRTVRPVSYDSFYEFLHVHRGSFPGEYGKKIQAIYLKEKGFKNSEVIQDFIDTYYSEKSSLISELSIIEKKLNKRLIFLGYPQKVIKNREITYKQKILKSCNYKKVILNWIKIPIKFVYIKLKKQENIKSYDDFFSKNIAISEVLNTGWVCDLYKSQSKG